MLSYQDWSQAMLKAEADRLEDQVSAWKRRGLKLNMTRGKPCAEQLDLSNGLLTCLDENDYRSEDKTDCRNYGGLDGLPEARRLFAGLLGIQSEQVMVLGNSSLNLMYDMMTRCLLFALPGAKRPWGREEKVRFICPVPGYDRHFTVCQALGIEMIPVPMTPQGPDMDQIEDLAASDPSIKGMWAVPVYSNPDGITYSAETCRRLAAMRTAAADFRIFWDNAYCIHHLDPDKPEVVPEILALCAEHGHADRVFVFASTSKITWSGAGLACLAASTANLAFVRRQMTAQTIGPDKISQLRHIRFLKDQAQVLDLMRRHAAILAPKFDLVDCHLTRELAGRGICRWHKPRGGYFFSLYLLPGTAAETVRLAKDCGVELTPAGSTWPGGRDPEDSNIRLAPSFPPLAELEMALEVLCLCIRLACVKRLLASLS